MCSARDDLRARALIRDEALRLYAASGPEAVSLRAVAAAAGVSPGLVVHHFGSKAGLREAVDAHVEGIFDAMFAALPETDWTANVSAGSLAEAFVSALPPDSPIPTYLRWLLLSGDDAGRRLFARWYDTCRVMADGLQAAGLLRPSADPAVRAAFLMTNDLAVLLLREHLSEVLGVDPLAREGMARWAGEVLTAYREGVFTSGEEKP